MVLKVWSPNQQYQHPPMPLDVQTLLQQGSPTSGPWTSTPHQISGGIRFEIKYEINIMHLIHPETTPPSHMCVKKPSSMKPAKKGWGPLLYRIRSSDCGPVGCLDQVFQVLLMWADESPWFRRLYWLPGFLVGRKRHNQDEAFVLCVLQKHHFASGSGDH